LAEHALGRPTAIESLEAGRALAERAGVPGQLARAYANLAYTADEISYRRMTEFHERGLEVASRYGLVQQHWAFRGQLAGSYYFLGRWDEAISHADAVIDAAESGGLWQLEATRGHVYRALMRVARGDLDGALDDVDRTLDSRTESHRLVAYLAAAALVLLQAGHRDKAADTIDQVLRIGSQRPRAANRWFADAACVLSGLGRPDVLTALVKDWKLPEDFAIDTGRAWLRSDPVAAADIYDGLANSADAAYARLRAGEQLLEQGRPAEAAAQLQRALEFYRSVAATRFVEEGEQMLVAARRSSTTATASG
jgi:tetratricopeptide (TPR) repeat protein